MGSSFEAQCTHCGHRRHGSIGGGMSNHTTYCSWPCLCRSCNAITTTNMLAEPRACSDCGGTDIAPYNDLAMPTEGPRRKRRKGKLRGMTFDPDPGDIRWGDLKLDTL